MPIDVFWQNERDEVDGREVQSISTSDCCIDMFDSIVPEDKLMKLGKLWAELKTFKAFVFYISHLLHYTSLHSYLEAGMITTKEK